MNHQQHRQQYPPQPPYRPSDYGPPPKPRRKWPWIVGGAALVLVIGASLASANTTPVPSVDGPPAVTPAEPDAPAFGGRVVTLEVEGDGTAQVSYMKSGGQESQEVKLPWSGGITADFVVSMTAQKRSGGSGDITCRIVEDGQVVAESTSSGQYAMVSCVD